MTDLEKRTTAPLFIVLNRYNAHGQFGPVLCWPDGEIVAGQRSTSVKLSAGSAIRTVTVEFVIGNGVVEFEEFVHLDVNDHRIVPLIKAARAVLDRYVFLDDDSEDVAFTVGELEAAIERYEAETPAVGVIKYTDLQARFEFCKALLKAHGINPVTALDEAFPPEPEPDS